MGCKRGCFRSVLKYFRRKPQNPADPNQPPYGVRPAHTAHDSIASGTSDLTDIEKAYIRDGNDKETGLSGGRRGPVSHLPPNASNFRPNVHPQFSAYAGVASRTDRASSFSRDNWTGSQASTKVPSTRQSEQQLSKIKDEGGVEDPEQEARRKKAEEIRRKFEEEEQERLDFFQMM